MEFFDDFETGVVDADGVVVNRVGAMLMEGLEDLIFGGGGDFVEDVFGGHVFAGHVGYIITYFGVFVAVMLGGGVCL